MHSSEYRPEIDGLRGIAVLGVLLFHLDIGFFKGGYIGVDIFFVISGFLITRLVMNDLASGQFSFSGFYARRARRILPALLVTVALSLIAGFLLFTPQHFERLARSSVYVSLAVPNLFFLSKSGYFDVEAIYKPLLHTWTLGVEEQFYLFWPLLLLFVSRLKQSQILTSFILLGSVSLYFSEALLETNPNLAFYLTPFRVFEFCLGGALVWIMYFQPGFKWIGEIVFLSGLDQVFDELQLSGIYVLSGHNNVPLKDGLLVTNRKPGKTNYNEFQYLQSIEFSNVILAARWHMYTNTSSHDLKGSVALAQKYLRPEFVR